MSKERIQPGQRVVVTNDNIWSQNLEAPDAGKIPLCDSKGNLAVYRVLSTRCSIPIRHRGARHNPWKANTLVKSEETGAVFALNECNLRLKIDLQEIETRYFYQNQDVTDLVRNTVNSCIIKQCAKVERLQNLLKCIEIQLEGGPDIVTAKKFVKQGLQEE